MHTCLRAVCARCVRGVCGVCVGCVQCVRGADAVKIGSEVCGRGKHKPHARCAASPTRMVSIHGNLGFRLRSLSRLALRCSLRLRRCTHARLPLRLRLRLGGRSLLHLLACACLYDAHIGAGV